MKTIRYLCPFFFFVLEVSCSTKSRKTDLQKLSFKGDLKKVKETKHRRVFDAGGNNSEMKLASIKQFDFDKNGNIKHSEYYFMIGAESFISVEDCKYDRQGNLSERRHYSPPGTLKNSTKILYDGNGRVIEEDEYNDKGILELKEKTYIDKSGKQVNTLGFNKNGDTTIETQDKYDESGVLQEHLYYGFHNKQTVLQGYYTYTNLGLLNEYTLYNEDRISAHRVYKYDVIGNCIQCEDQALIEGKNVVTVYKYENTIDYTGNVTKVIETDDKGISTTTEREFEYY